MGFFKERNITNIAITGISGFLGSRLVERLINETTVERIIGFDIAAPRSLPPKVKFFQMDVLDPAIVSVLEKQQIETIIHLAFVLFPLREKKRHYAIDVDGSRNVLEAAEKTNIKKIIIASSTSVYGVHDDNPELIYEEYPLKPNPDNEYAVHKTEVEALVAAFRQRHPEVCVTVFRPCMILGPHMDNLICKMACLLPCIITAKSYDPLLQFVHEDDVVAAFIMAIFKDLPGIFNLVGSGTINMKEFCSIFNKNSLAVPFPLLYNIHSFLWTIRFPLITFSAGWLHFFRYACIASGEKIKKEHCFYPAFSSGSALQSYVAART